MTEDLKSQYEYMTQSQKEIAEYILDAPEIAVFMTASKLARAVGVSEATVIRLAQKLGFDGYSEFQQALMDELQEELLSTKKVQTERIKAEPSETMRKVLVQDAQNIVDTIHLVEDKTFEAAVDMIQEAKRVYILGLRSCKPLADYFCYYLGLIRPDVYGLSSSNVSELYEQLQWIGKEDLLIGISFPRYSSRTLKAMDFANSRGAGLIAITDSKYSPMNMYSSVNLWVRTDMITMLESLVGPMSLVNAVVVAMYMRNEDKVKENLEILETMWDTYQTYDRDELGDPGE